MAGLAILLLVFAGLIGVVLWWPASDSPQEAAAVAAVRQKAVSVGQARQAQLQVLRGQYFKPAEMPRVKALDATQTSPQ